MTPRTRTRIPTNDLEANALVYRAMEEPLAKVLRTLANRTAKGMFRQIERILRASGYTQGDKARVLIKQANPETMRVLEELAKTLPDKQRERFVSKLFGQVTAGSLTTKKAIDDVIQYGHYANTLDLYVQSRNVLKDVAVEGMLRGEFMVQKGVGLAWEVDAPGIKRVESFLDKEQSWTRNKATEYLKGMSDAVKGQVTEGLAMGESPGQIANRLRTVEDMNEVRAMRNARTITNAVANDAQAKTYERYGIERYEFACLFDERTCPECGRLDGQRFDMADRTPGVNYPPIHPNCRCSTHMVMDDDTRDKLYSRMEIRLHDGSVRYIDARQSYDDWAKNGVRYVD